MHYDSMHVISWIILGLIAGFIAAKIVNHKGEGVILDILLGIIGAFVGTWVFGKMGMHGANGVNLYSIMVSAIGAILVLVIYHGIRRAI
jgi:uncharacterized membrane protein YeaQ/YmgE (transglycosylase-associated protein family)